MLAIPYINLLLYLSVVGYVKAVALPQTLTPLSNSIKDWLSPPYTPFQAQLAIMPTAQPKATYTEPVNGTVIDFFEIDIRQFTAQTYPLSSGVGPTTYVGYDGIAPGPTLSMTRGREAVVRFTNSYDRPSSIHLHGSYSRAPWDGWAEDVTNPGEFKDYYYPNGQPQRTLWYHDHAIGITAVNAYFGQAGFYILEDPEAPTTLPIGDYDVPLMLAGKQFNEDGSLFSPIDERVSLYGDVITVNGVPWPYHQVEPRKYKFRLLDASISRSFSLYLIDEANPSVHLPFAVVGADAGYMDHPVTTDSLVIAMAERWEIVIDFALYQGKSLVLMNERKFQTNEDYPETNKVMKWIVGSVVTSDVQNGPLPTHLADLKDPGSHAIIDHEFVFERNNGQWLINGVGFEDIPNRILAKPPQGGVERWRLVNKAGGWSHPIHIHLIDFKIVSRTGGRAVVEEYEAAALKDVVYLGENEAVEVIANYQPWGGVYMFHCHNLVHEDHDMMAAFNVTDVDLSAFGYPDNATFTDPMAAIWRSKPRLAATDLQDVQGNILPLFAGLGAYPSTENVEHALQEYYVDHVPIDGIASNVKARNEVERKVRKRKSYSSGGDDDGNSDDDGTVDDDLI
ncbi:related to bilirubin oxidase [Phialocephala subalpina]|uniref:Related to bilirubin oxidase n=1 Tax=Phialocephala subalpina TaxID=576137 RepID=A0A1L7XCE4_9HELO|nr:related to bilirubin oxidase [Phialocephala subalpina]